MVSPVNFVRELRQALGDESRLKILFDALKSQVAGLEGLALVPPQPTEITMVFPIELKEKVEALGPEVLAQAGRFLSQADALSQLDGADATLVLRLSTPHDGLYGFLLVLGPTEIWMDSSSPARESLYQLSAYWMDQQHGAHRTKMGRETVNRLSLIQHYLKKFRELVNQQEQEAWIAQLLMGWDQLLDTKGIAVRFGEVGEGKLIMAPGAAPRAGLYDALVRAEVLEHPIRRLVVKDHPYGPETGSVLFIPLIGKTWLGVVEAPLGPGKEILEDDLAWLELSAEVMGLALGTYLQGDATETAGKSDGLEEVANALPMALMVLDENERISLLNESMVELAVSRPEVGVNFRRFFDPETSALMEKLLDGEAELREDTSSAGGRQHRFLAKTISGDNTLIVILDETDSKELLALRDLDQLKSDFVSAASHEIRTPLTSIQGFVKTLLGPRGSSYSEEDRQEFYTIILNEAERLTRLVENILDVSRIESGAALRLNRSHIEVGPWLKELVDKAQDRDSFHTYFLACPEGLSLLADDIKLEHVITNLLGNAGKYTPEGCHITAGSRAAEGGLEIWVEDDGPGVPTEDVPHLFRRFFRGTQEKSSRAKGTGLGLYLARQLVLAHGGELSYENLKPQGAKFVVFLPEKKLKSR